MIVFSKRAIAFILAIAALSLCGAAFALPLYSQKDLDLGDYGEDVVRLQIELRALNLFNGVYSGVYDEATVAGVTALQKLLDVDPDGKFGADTFSAYVQAVKDGKLIPNYDYQNNSEAGDALVGKAVGIDPGHQAKPDHELERMSPESSRTKMRMSGGAYGVKSGVDEASIVLQISAKLGSMLQDAGAKVVYTRTSNDVSISNQERAAIMNEAGVDVWIRLHCDSSCDARARGAAVLIPTTSANPAIAKASDDLGAAVLSSFCTSTRATSRGLLYRANQTGFNWSHSPVIAIEMGYLSNPEDDVKLNCESYQFLCASGICSGVIDYFASDTEE